jgi:hypothetical protein
MEQEDEEQEEDEEEREEGVGVRRDTLSVCGSGSGSSAGAGNSPAALLSVDRLAFLSAVEVSQLLMPRLALLRCFLADLSWRLGSPPLTSADSTEKEEEWVHQCLVAAFLKCCQFAAEYLDESKGQAVLSMFPLALKLAIESALFHTRHSLLPAERGGGAEEKEKAKEAGAGAGAGGGRSGHTTRVHACLFCPYNPLGWPGISSSTSCHCHCFAADSPCHCKDSTAASSSSAAASAVFLPWPIDLLQLVGREDHIVNSSFSCHTTPTHQKISSMTPHRGGGGPRAVRTAVRSYGTRMTCC